MLDPGLFGPDDEGTYLPGAIVRGPAIVQRDSNCDCVGCVDFRIAKLGEKSDAIRSLLHDVIGEDIDREGLKETPDRVVKAWAHWCGGYKVDIPGLLKVFEDGAENCNEMVIRKNIRIYSHCEHHLAPIIGNCTIGYVPNGRIVGLSKLDRVADAFARRLQVQERLTRQIAEAIYDNIGPYWVGVYIDAEHLCVASRGVEQHVSNTVTKAFRSELSQEGQNSYRNEFLSECMK